MLRLTEATFLAAGAVKEDGANAKETLDDTAITRAERPYVNFILNIELKYWSGPLGMATKLNGRNEKLQF